MGNYLLLVIIQYYLKRRIHEILNTIIIIINCN